MKRIKKKLTAMLNAMTFAEAGEHDAAIAFMENGAPEPDVPQSSEVSRQKSASADNRGLLKRIEDQLVAAAFAEAGEFETARSLVRAGSRPKTVMLVCDGERIEPGAFSHALNLCKRLDAALEIVVFISGPEGTADGSPGNRALDERIAAWSQRAGDQGVSCTVDTLLECSNNVPVDRIRRHMGIAAVVDGSIRTGPDTLNNNCIREFLEGVARKLAVPLVRVMKKPAMASHA